MNPISYITANLVARPLGFNMTGGWMEGDDATHDLFRPAERFAARFDDMIGGIRALGYTSVDLWCAHLHAKDVKPRRTGPPTGYALIDMGHETCTLGDGVAGIENVIRQAVAGGFKGPIGIEHEPETHDPADDCKESLVRVKRWLS